MANLSKQLNSTRMLHMDHYYHISPPHIVPKHQRTSAMCPSILSFQHYTIAFQYFWDIL